MQSLLAGCAQAGLTVGRSPTAPAVPQEHSLGRRPRWQAHLPSLDRRRHPPPWLCAPACERQPVGCSGHSRPSSAPVHMDKWRKEPGSAPTGALVTPGEQPSLCSNDAGSLQQLVSWQGKGGHLQHAGGRQRRRLARRADGAAPGRAGLQQGAPIMRLQVPHKHLPGSVSLTVLDAALRAGAGCMEQQALPSTAAAGSSQTGDCSRLGGQRTLLSVPPEPTRGAAVEVHSAYCALSSCPVSTRSATFGCRLAPCATQHAGTPAFSVPLSFAHSGLGPGGVLTACEAALPGWRHRRRTLAALPTGGWVSTFQTYSSLASVCVTTMFLCSAVPRSLILLICSRARQAGSHGRSLRPPAPAVRASPGWAMAFCCLMCLLLSLSLKLKICSAAAVRGCTQQR